MNKIRIAFFADMMLEKFDGYSRTIHNLIKRVPSDRYEFLFITGTKPNKKDANYNYIHIPSIPIPTNKNYKMALPLLAKLRLDAALRDYRPHVLHISNPSLLGKYASEYGLKHNIPSVSIYHTHYVSYVKYYLRNLPSLIPVGERYISNVNKKIYDNCNIVYVPAQSITDHLNRKGFATDHYKIWQRGIDTQVFNPSKRNTESIKAITQNDNFNILFASRIVWEKNLDTLIKIYNKMQHLPVNFIVAGTGVAEEELKGKMPKAHFVGHMEHEELSTLYASSDLFLFPSDTESFGNVVLEAMASGTPVVAANAGGPVGILKNGVSGFLCDSHLPDAYIEKINLLIHDDSARNQMIDNALLRVQDFSWDRLTQTYCNDIALLSDIRQPIYA